MRYCSGGPVPAGATGNWQQAMAAIKLVNDTTGFAGYHDWRLPNIKELESIIERSCLNPAINPHVFPNSPTGLYWTSTPDGQDEDSTWAFRFNNGEDTELARTNSFYVRAVRGGQ
jgi:hypothetical protein